MNKTTTLILSLLFASSAAYATQPYSEPLGSELSMDQINVNLDWDAQQFGWSADDCLDVAGEHNLSANCKTAPFNLEDDNKRNQPPATNHQPTNLPTGQ
ncbi:MAG: hypothetical protein ACRC8Q_09805 [Aeromonas sp.]